MPIWRQLSAIVAEHGAAVLVSVQDARGSTPREAGAALVVRPGGAFHGTIGGGRLEWEALREARAALAAGRGPAQWRDHVLGPDLGQCCGGRVTLRVETFDERDGAELAWLAEAEGEGCAVDALVDATGRVARRALAISPSRRERGRGEGAHVRASAPDGRAFLPPPSAGEGQPAGGRQGEGASGISQGCPDPPSPAALLLRPRLATPPLPACFAGCPSPAEGGGGRRWTEQLGEFRTPLLLFGAGHVGRALVLALAPLPFAIRWIDGRADAFPAHVPANARPVLASDPSAEVDAAPPGAFVLVMTHDHALDLSLTAAALGRVNLPFVGLIGSATKRARFERRFREIGLPAARIAALRCPIGLPGVEGKEPAVIAASVAAQLLVERARSPQPLPAETAELAPA